MVVEDGVRTKKCGICTIEFPMTPTHFYRNAGEPGGFSRVCKECADTAKKRYKLKYNRNRLERKANVKPRRARLSDRVQYALLTGRCPRCGGRLQNYKDAFEKDAPCMECLICSREVWLPPLKEVREFLANPPSAVAMPAWVKKVRKRSSRLGLR